MARPVPVEWHDSAWRPRIVVRSVCAGETAPRRNRLSAAKSDTATATGAGTGFPLPRLRLSPSAEFRGHLSSAPVTRNTAPPAPRITYQCFRGKAL
jgi:hypothetical protein